MRTQAKDGRAAKDLAAGANHLFGWVVAVQRVQAGAVEAVQIIRLDYRSPPQQFAHSGHVVFGRMQGRSGGYRGSSPILLLKNFNQDRGLKLYEAIFGKNPPHIRPEQHLSQFGGVRNLPEHADEQEALKRASDRALDICEHAVRWQGDEGQRALCALKSRSRWYPELSQICHFTLILAPNRCRSGL